MSKKTKIILFTLLFTVVFMVIGFFAVREVYNNLLEGLISQFAQEEVILAKQTASSLETQVSTIEEKLYLISKIPEIQSGDTEECNKKLDEILLLNTQVNNVGRVSIDKKFKCSFNKALVGTDATKLGSYINQIFDDPDHKPVMSRVIKLPDGQFAVAVHIPVFDAKNKFIGTLGGAIYFNQISEKNIKNVKVSDGGYIVLQDDDGVTLYHPQKDLIGTSRWPKNEEQAATASAATKALMQSAKDGKPGIVRYVAVTLDNKEKVAAYAPAQVFHDRKWLVLVTVPIEDILKWDLVLQSRRAFGLLFLLVILTILIPPFLLVLYLNYSVFRPLSRIGKASKELGSGNLDVVLPVNSQDEIGILSKAFNDMASQLKEFYRGLSDKVKEKTDELEQRVQESEKQNKLLEDTKLATLNILEDLQETKTEIEREKLQDEALLSSIGDGVFAIDASQKIILFNKAAENISGFSAKDVIGKVYSEVLEFIFEKDGKTNDAFVTEALSGKNSEMANHTQLKHKDGHFVPVSDSAAPLLTKDKKVEGVVIVFRDVTKEQQLERMKDEFVSIASHELRTPMTAIKGFVSMIKDGDYGKLPTQMEEPLTDIGNSTDRLITLVTDMLNVSRIEAGRLKFDLTKFNTVDVINEVISTLQPIVKDKKITLKANKLDPSEVTADINKVKQVLNNLIGNSLKFTEKGGIEVSSVKDGDLLKIMVTDTGLGISAEDQKLLFGKFKQIQSAQDGKPAGTGLGLYLSRELVRKMGGDLWIEKSEPKKGSTFAFSVPVSGSKTAKEVETVITKDAEAHPDQKSE